ncbi:hypothetical protein [Actinoplanes couchii]|nr:hypothetical protein [Actinoplanes couchii]MDR6322427.1 hypothetical protein [Actinoplanes couchii]
MRQLPLPTPCPRAVHTSAVARTALVLAGAVLAGGLSGTGPAAATVTYDFDTGIGFVGSADLIKGFGWKAGRLTRKVAEIEFQEGMYIEEIWSVTCRAGAAPFTANRAQQAMKEFLTATAEHGPKRVLTGFRLSGAKAAISSTTAPFEVGGPCPDPAQGDTVRTLRQTATTTTRNLIAVTDDESATLIETRTGTPRPGSTPQAGGTPRPAGTAKPGSPSRSSAQPRPGAPRTGPTR